MVKSPDKKQYSEEEFDRLVDISVKPYLQSGWRSVKSSWRFILFSGLVLTALGGLSFLFVPFRYVAISKVAPEWNNSNKQMSTNVSLSALINSVNSSETVAIRPEMFPSIISSETFIQGLFGMRVGDGTLYDYANEHRVSVFDFISGDTDRSLVTNYLSEAITAIVDTKTCLMTLWVKLPDQDVAVALSERIISDLKSFVAGYLRHNALEAFESAQSLYENAQKEYAEAQNRYSRYVDSHQGMKGQGSAVYAESLKAEMKLKSTEVEKQFMAYNAARETLEFDPPVLSVIQTPVATEPKPLGIAIRIINSLLIGVILSSLLAFFFKKQSNG